MIQGQTRLGPQKLRAIFDRRVKNGESRIQSGQLGRDDDVRFRHNTPRISPMRLELMGTKVIAGCLTKTPPCEKHSKRQPSL